MHVYRVGILTILMALASCATRRYERDIYRGQSMGSVNWETSRCAVSINQKGEVSGFEAAFAQAFGSGSAFSDQLNQWTRDRFSITDTFPYEHIRNAEQRPQRLRDVDLDYVIFVDRWAVLESVRAVQRPPTMGQPYAASRSKRVCHIYLEGGVYDGDGRLLYRGEIHGEFLFQHSKTLKNACFRASRMFQKLIEDRIRTDRG